MREPQSSVAQEVEREITMVSHTSTAATQRGAERGEIRSAEIGKFAALEVAPDGLDRIQVRRIGWQPLDAQPLARTGQIAQHYATLVRRQSIPDEDHWLTAEVTLQLPEKRDEGAVGVRAGLRVKEEACASAIPPEGQRRRHRQPLPGAADMSQDGRVAPRGPRAADDGLLREPAFVLEDEPRAAPLGVFFSCVQRRVFQRVIAASSRSRARRAGRWSDQPNRRSSRQTWLGWCRMPVSRSMTWAMRGSVHRSVLNPCRPGPARSAWSTFASSVAPNRGRRPARPAPFNPVRPLFFHAWYQWWALTRVTPSVRATATCDSPRANSRAACSRRASIAAKSRDVVGMRQHAIVPVKSVSLFCKSQ